MTMKTRINMITLMNLAWDRRKALSHEEYEIKIRNLLSHAYVECSELYEAYCKNEGKAYEDEIFYAFQRIFVFIMLCDGDFLQGEYDAYLKMCDNCNFQPLSVDDCRSLYNRMTVDDLAKQVSLLVNVLRDFIDGENYEAMVQGFCYLALAGDKEMDENEYYVLRGFFESGYDYAPSTWEQFKREW